MNYKSQIVSSHSSFSYLNRYFVFNSEPAEPARAGQQAKGRGQTLLGIILFTLFFFGILSAFGYGLSRIGNSSNISQSVTKYVKRLG
jgi:hypothetical protein